MHLLWWRKCATVTRLPKYPAVALAVVCMLAIKWYANVMKWCTDVMKWYADIMKWYADGHGPVSPERTH